jgi:hypothetical protein
VSRKSLRIGLLWLVLLSADGWSLVAADSAALLIPRHAEWKYYAQRTAPPTEWSQPSFDDRAWKTATTGIGYGDDDDRTALPDMRGQYKY